MISIGPFSIDITDHVRLANTPHDRLEISYAGERFGWHHVPTGASRNVIAEAFADDIAAWCAALMPTTPVTVSEPVQALHLLDVATDKVIGSMPWATEIAGLRNALPDNRSATWLVTNTSPAMAMPMTEEEFNRLCPVMIALHTERLVRAEQAARATAAARPARSWIAQLLPDAVLTHNPAAWRAPTSWEIRHIVGEGSLTGISGAKAAELIGVTASNFRKYTAADDARTRQNMGFAMWHALLHTLDVQHLHKWCGA